MSNLGRVKSMQGHLEEAENIYKDALELDTIDEAQEATLRHSLGFIFSTQGSYDKALRRV